MSRHQVRGRVVVYCLRELVRVRLLPYVGPLLEHFGVIRQRDVLPLLVKHDLGREGGDYPKGALHPHLAHWGGEEIMRGERS